MLRWFAFGFLFLCRAHELLKSETIGLGEFIEKPAQSRVVFQQAFAPALGQVMQRGLSLLGALLACSASIIGAASILRITLPMYCICRL